MTPHTQICPNKADIFRSALDSFGVGNPTLEQQINYL